MARLLLHDRPHRQLCSALHGGGESLRRMPEKLRTHYETAFEWTPGIAVAVILSMGVLALVSSASCRFSGRISSCGGRQRVPISCRAPEGTRIEVTQQRFFSRRESNPRGVARGRDSERLANIGLPASGINLAFSDNANISAADGEILVSLNPKHHAPTANHVRISSRTAAPHFPDMEFAFSSPDIGAQILNFWPACADRCCRSPETTQKITRRRSGSRHASRRYSARVDVHLLKRVHGPGVPRGTSIARSHSRSGSRSKNVADTLLTVAQLASGQASPN